jgi:hypothetical protein
MKGALAPGARGPPPARPPYALRSAPFRLPTLCHPRRQENRFVHFVGRVSRLQIWRDDGAALFHELQARSTSPHARARARAHTHTHTHTVHPFIAFVFSSLRPSFLPPSLSPLHPSLSRCIIIHAPTISRLRLTFTLTPPSPHPCYLLSFLSPPRRPFKKYTPHPLLFSTPHSRGGGKHPITISLNICLPTGDTS